MKKALITGITGQDGSYLTEFLLSKGYEVHGIIRRASTFNTHRIDHIYVDPHNPKAKLFLHYGDMSDAGSVNDIVWNIRPDEIYNLAAQSHVRVSFDMPEYTGNVTGLGVCRLLEAVGKSGLNIKFYQASSSEMFGGAPAPQNEATRFYPRSPYAAAKVYAYWMVVNYREAYNMFACNGILFNHESPRRGETFVTRKITRGISNLLKGYQNVMHLGNLDARRDWGFAPEYVEVMWLMLQQDRPDDYVIGTGQCYSVRDFLNTAFSYLKIEVEWKGSGVDEEGIVKSFDKRWAGNLTPGKVLVKIDPRYFRPTEVDELRADIEKASKSLNWAPRTSFNELVKIMVDYDLKGSGLTPPGEGIEVCKEKGFCYTEHKFSFHQRIREE